MGCGVHASGQSGHDVDAGAGNFRRYLIRRSLAAAISVT